LMIPWGDYTANPAYFMLAPQLFTDVDLQAYSTDDTLAAMPEESLATGKWYHVTMTVDNAAMKAMTKYDAATTLENVSFTVKDLTTNESIVPDELTVTSPYTDSVSARQAAASVLEKLLGGTHIGIGAYSVDSHKGYVADGEGGISERNKVDYYVDNVKFSCTPTDTLFETTNVLLEERTEVYQTTAVGTSWYLPGGEIGTYNEENPDANIGDGYDAFNYVVTFDLKTDADVFCLEMYGKNTVNTGNYMNHINTADGGQSRRLHIPVEESARGKKFSYKVVNGKHQMYVYRAECGSNVYTLISEITSKGGASNMKSSAVRFIFGTSYGATTGTYVNYENLLVVNKGAMSITNKNDSAVEIAFETGNSEKAFPILAFFDGEGRLVEASTPGERTLENGEGTAPFNITGKAYETAQIFLWDLADGFVPIAETPWVID